MRADRPIRVAVVDRQPAVRAGLDAILRAEPGVAPAGAAPDPDTFWPLLYRARPDVVLLDHHPASGANLGLGLRITARPFGPRVVLWATEPGSELVVPAAFAGVDAIVGKAADARELLDAVRAVARGERLLPRFTPALQSAAAERLRAKDRAIFAMRLAGTPARDIADVAGLSARELEARSAAIVAALAARECCAEPRRPLDAALATSGGAA